VSTALPALAVSMSTIAAPPVDASPVDMTVLRTATLNEAAAVHALIAEHLAEGHFLPRELHEIAVNAHRFVVALQADEAVACAELAPLSHDVSQVRSLIVSHDASSLGVGLQIVDDLGLRDAQRVYPRPRLLRAAGVLRRAARLATGEVRHGLPYVHPLQTLRPVRRRADARPREAGVRAACRPAWLK